MAEIQKAMNEKAEMEQVSMDDLGFNESPASSKTAKYQTADSDNQLI
jgi:hypothetical protein